MLQFLLLHDAKSLKTVNFCKINVPSLYLQFCVKKTDVEAFPKRSGLLSIHAHHSTLWHFTVQDQKETAEVSLFVVGKTLLKRFAEMTK